MYGLLLAVWACDQMPGQINTDKIGVQDSRFLEERCEIQAIHMLAICRYAE